MRYLPWLVVGVSWTILAVVLLGLLGQAPSDYMADLAKSDHVRSMTVEVVTDDRFGPIHLGILPVALAVDLLSWTVGVAAWVIVRGPWPGAALGALAAPHPTLSWVLVVLFSVLATAGPLVGLGALLRLAFAEKK